RDAGALAPSGPAELLPRRGDRTRIAREDRHVAPADVDPEFERVRRDVAQDLAIAETAFDRSTFRGQVAAAISAHPTAWAEALTQRLAQPGQQQLDGDPRSAEG